MTLLYQPISRTFGQRDGCLTPLASIDCKLVDNKPEVSNGSAALTPTHKILSPPLSPYQRDTSSQDAKVDVPATSTTGQYLASTYPFKVENFRNYSLTINPWPKVDSHYKQRQLDFLSQYTLEAPRVVHLHPGRISQRRPERRRSEPHSTSSEEESADSVERVRTRKMAKESRVSESETSATAESVSLLPQHPAKKRRVRKEPSYAGSPLAAQQEALIDESIPDYSPDAYATLPAGNNRALKIEWKGKLMDLRNDPNLDKLHPAEVVLASILRLRCSVYLDSKRRFFQEKVNRARKGMPFRRTDAQKACRIDVNKASRLFVAFEMAGWLNDKHFKKYL